MAKIVTEAIRVRSGYPDFSGLYNVLKRKIDAKVKPELLSYFTRIVAYWEHKPEFRARLRITSDEVSVYVFPAGEHKDIWLWVSGGTRAHTIVPKSAGYPLRFRTDYKPRTGRGYRYRGPGESVGPWVRASVVEHPGIKPREFEKHMTRFYQPKYNRRIAAALKEGVAKL